ncbi:MAG: hypothetical protein N0E55_14580, partial [Candidatus Thiodiazotropha taylori]|nr:hypothetical protein [Candidatus Thiodiazotropha taylori]MCW4253907.1 hypothetical protein [Candidatus Thiodiazotropha taylori]
HRCGKYHSAVINSVATGKSKLLDQQIMDSIVKAEDILLINRPLIGRQAIGRLCNETQGGIPCDR